MDDEIRKLLNAASNDEKTKVFDLELMKLEAQAKKNVDIIYHELYREIISNYKENPVLNPGLHYYVALTLNEETLCFDSKIHEQYKNKVSDLVKAHNINHKNLIYFSNALPYEMLDIYFDTELLESKLVYDGFDIQISNNDYFMVSIESNKFREMLKKHSKTR